MSDAKDDPCRKYRVLLDALDDAVALVQTVRDADQVPIGYRVQEVNRAFGELALLDGERVQSGVIPSADAWWLDVERRLADDEIVRFETEVVASGEWLQVMALRIDDRQWAVVFRPTTARRRQEADLRAREARLKKEDRRKDEFLAVLAHELRNPLAPVRTGIELLQLHNTRSGGSVDRIHTMMERQVSQMARLVDSLLDVSRLASGQFELHRAPVLLSTVVDAALADNRAAIDASQMVVRVDLPKEPIALDGDAARLTQVLSHVLANAIKYTDTSGWVGVSAVRAPLGESKTPGVAITIADSGVGIAADRLGHVFDLFSDDESGPRHHKGLGIGLALSRRLAALHGGTLEAASEGLGQGSAFTLRLPIITAAAATTPLPLPAATVGPAGMARRRVLVIDDNSDAADSLSMFVTAAGGECRVAYDGERGLREGLTFRPDVILLDIGMPGMDGYETCRRIRRTLGPGVVVVALSGWGQDNDQERARGAGFDAHLTKPVSAVELQHVIADCRAPAAATTDWAR